MARQCPHVRIMDLEKRIKKLEATLTTVYHDCKLRAVDGVVPLGFSCWINVVNALMDCNALAELREQHAGVKLNNEWNSYPIGTKAYASGGGYWEKVLRGWKWCTGATFPTPGGDVIRVEVSEQEAIK